ncbi:hypothetical protein WJX72_004571 [[Myrmecia] bisecta]|uniref:Uncharacterized protein n=1 Tax=[Myrmecia] bisecta TaxID=41462 RepID=A0AAW1QAF2_9CHLO
MVAGSRWSLLMSMVTLIKPCLPSNELLPLLVQAAVNIQPLFRPEDVVHGEVARHRLQAYFPACLLINMPVQNPPEEAFV